MKVVQFTREGKSFWTFAGLCFVYAILELAYNRSLLSVSSSYATQQQLDVIEWVGRTMAGVGLSLVAWRTLHGIRSWLHKKDLAQGFLKEPPIFTWSGFALCLAICVPSMWALEEAVIRILVNKATPLELQSSVIASYGRQSFQKTDWEAQAKMSIVPFAYKSPQQMKDFQRAVIACRTSLEPEATPPAAFVSLLASWSTFSASLRQQLMDAPLKQLQCHMREYPKLIDAHFDRYQEAWLKYDSWLDMYQKGSAEMHKQTRNGWVHPNRLKRMWEEHMTKAMGFPSTLTWNLTSGELEKHPDVIRLFQTNYAVSPEDYPRGLSHDEFKRQVLKSFPKSVNAISATENGGGFLLRQAQQAYRIGVVVWIGLFVSLFFGLYNSGAVLMSILGRLTSWTPGVSHHALLLASIAVLPLALSPPGDQDAQSAFFQEARSEHPMMGTLLLWTQNAEQHVSSRRPLHPRRGQEGT